MLSTIVSHLIAIAVGAGGGWYGHYRYGSSVKNAIAKVETRITETTKKL